MDQGIEWFRVRSADDLETMRDTILSRPSFDSFTDGKRDKNDNPICFIGNMRRGAARVDAHFAVWFRDELLEAEGMKIISSLKMGQRHA